MTTPWGAGTRTPGTGQKWNWNAASIRIHYYDGTVWHDFTGVPKAWNGSAWVAVTARYWNGSAWVY